MRWMTQNPGIGDTASLRTRAGTMDTIVLQLDLARTQIRTRHEALTTDLWSGTAADAFHQSCQNTLSRLDSLIDSLAPYSSALVVYAAEIDEISEEARLLDEKASEAALDLQSASAVLDRFPPPGVVITADQIRRAQASRTDAQTTLSSVSRDRSDLVQRRRDADTVVAAALGTVPVADWTTSGAALSTAGITSTDQLDSAAIRDALLDLSDLAAEGHTESIEQFAAMLAKWRDDPILMRDLMDELGGEGLSNLLTRLDTTRAEGTSTAPQVLQEELRHALSAASPLWSDAEAATFAASLVDARGGAVPIAFLFADVDDAPMSAHLVQSVADSIQDWEQEHGGLFTAQYLNVGTGMAADLLYRPLDEGVYWVDPADSLFRQLAVDPTATLEWLADDEHGSDRAAYWYGTRDWHDGGGGYTAPMLAWEALQTVPGGLLGPGHNPAIGEALATVNANIINAWTTDPYTGFMDEEALVALAGVVSAHLPVWADTLTTLADDLDNQAEASDELAIMWMGESGHGWITSITNDAFTDIMNQIARNAVASGRVLDAAKDLQAGLVASVGTAPGMTYDEALQRMAGILGIIDGSHLANELSTARMQDATVERLVDVAGLLGGEVVSKGGFAASVILSAGEDAATNAWADAYDSALDQFWAGEGAPEERRVDAEKALRDMIKGWVPEEQIHLNDRSEDQYMRDVMFEYDAGVQRMHPSK